MPNRQVVPFRQMLQFSFQATETLWKIHPFHCKSQWWWLIEKDSSKAWARNSVWLPHRQLGASSDERCKSYIHRVQARIHAWCAMNLEVLVRRDASALHDAVVKLLHMRHNGEDQTRWSRWQLDIHGVGVTGSQLSAVSALPLEGAGPNARSINYN